MVLFPYHSAPSAPPEHVFILNATLHTITVGWSEVPCTHRNGYITGYHIVYFSDAMYDFNVSGNSVTISDLQSDTEYSISVAAVNDAGVGVYGTITGKMQTCKLMDYTIHNYKPHC